MTFGTLVNVYATRFCSSAKIYAVVITQWKVYKKEKKILPSTHKVVVNIKWGKGNNNCR